MQLNVGSEPTFWSAYRTNNSQTDRPEYDFRGAHYTMPRQAERQTDGQKVTQMSPSCKCIGQWCAIPAKVDSNSIPIPDKALRFNSDSNSTLQYISSIQSCDLAFDSILIPIPSCDFSLRFNSDSNSIGPENPWKFDSSSNSGIGIAHHWYWWARKLYNNVLVMVYVNLPRYW